MRRRKVQAEHCSEWRSLADTPSLNLRYTEGRWPFNTECGRASDQVCTSNRGRVGLEFGTKSVDRTPVADHDRSVLTKRWGAKTPGGPDPGAPKIPALGVSARSSAVSASKVPSVCWLLIYTAPSGPSPRRWWPLSANTRETVTVPSERNARRRRRAGTGPLTPYVVSAPSIT